MLNRLFLTLAIVFSVQFFLTSTVTGSQSSGANLSQKMVNSILTWAR
jgi:hypothetical protein